MYTQDASTFSSTNSPQFGKNSTLAQKAYLLWTSTGIPQGSTASAASLTFIAGASLSGTTVNVLIGCEDVDNAAAPTTYSDANGRSYTASTTAWSPGAWTYLSSYASPDFSASLNQLLGRAGFGGNVHVMIRDNGSSTSARRVGVDFTADSTKATQLDVTYTAPASGGAYRLTNGLVNGGKLSGGKLIGGR